MNIQKNDAKRLCEKNVGEFFKDQSGFTLIEALVVMVVGVAVLAGAAAGIGRLFAASNVSTEAQNITLLSANIKGMKDGPSGYAALSMVNAAAFKAIPENMTMGGTAAAPTIVNLWNGDVTVAPVSAGGNKSFSIKYEGVPEDACKQLALKLKGGGWEDLTVKGISIKPTDGLTQIDAACKPADKASSVTMIFQGR
jgi:prepilin-type N-terminal cleavage/methylation domain-containing protein